MNLTFLSAKSEKRDSPLHGRGLFATRAIDAGEVVAVKGGYIMTKSAWEKLEASVGYAGEVQVSDDLVIAPSAPEEFEGAMMCLNHSCDPNCGVQGQIEFVAMRDIAAGEEITLDYAMFDDYDGEMDCSCAARECRGVVTGKDWKKPELQDRYRGYFSSYLQRRIGR